MARNSEQCDEITGNPSHRLPRCQAHHHAQFFQLFAAEFIIDFTRVLPGVPKAKVHARIITTPQHAKLLLNALKDNIEKYERTFGEIKIHGEPSAGGVFGFQPPTSGDKVH